MTSPARYPVPATVHRVEEEIKRSRFITTVTRAATPDEASAFIRLVTGEFPDATHHCWAYVAGPPGSTSKVGMSDAGEPHGTAGRPMLTALLHSGVGDIAVVVTRYFGGTKLGTGGLVRAYGGGVQHALATLPLAEYVDLAALRVTLTHSGAAWLRQILPSFEAEVLSELYEVDVRFELRLPRGRIEAFRSAVLDATRGQAEISPLE